MSTKFLKLIADIQVVACTDAYDYNVVTKERTPKKTKDGISVKELHVPVKTKIKKGDVELEELTFEKINSLVTLPPGVHTVELETFEMKDGKVYFRVKNLIQQENTTSTKKAN